MSDPTVVVVNDPEPTETAPETVIVETPPADPGEAVEAVIDLSVEHRLTVIEQAMPNLVTRDELDRVRDTAYQAQDLALDAGETAAAAAADAEEATTPAEVEATIEGTEIVENAEGEIALDAPSDTPPPESRQHWTQVSGKELLGRIGKKLGS